MVLKPFILNFDFLINSLVICRRYLLYLVLARIDKPFPPSEKINLIVVMININFYHQGQNQYLSINVPLKLH